MIGSVPVTSARSHRCSVFRAVDRAPECGLATVSQAFVEVRRHGAGLRTAPATGRFGRRWSGSTTSTSLATSRNRSLTEAMTDVFWSPSAP